MNARRISYADLETWRALLTLAGDVIEAAPAAKAAQQVRRLQRQADRARRARFPVDDAEARVTFSPLLRLIATYAEADRTSLVALVDACRAHVFPSQARKDVHG